MAGHSKWANIKHRKARQDAARGKAWSKCSRAIIVAARQAGGDPEYNLGLRYAIEMAKAANMPKDTIAKAIKRGTGEIEGSDYEEVNYEGYAPHGIALFIESLTDNTNRTVADLRSIFSNAGGNLGNAGSVAFLFDQKGVFEIPAAGRSEDDLFMLVANAGAEDLRKEDDSFVVETSVEAFGAVQSALQAAGIEPEEVYNLACVRVLQGKIDEAQKLLGQAMDFGTLPSNAHLLADSDLERIRDEPWFVDLLATREG